MAFGYIKDQALVKALARVDLPFKVLVIALVWENSVLPIVEMQPFLPTNAVLVSLVLPHLLLYKRHLRHTHPQAHPRAQLLLVLDNADALMARYCNLVSLFQCALPFALIMVVSSRIRGIPQLPALAAKPFVHAVLRTRVHVMMLALRVSVMKTVEIHQFLFASAPGRL